MFDKIIATVNSILFFLQGKKTYFVGGITICIGLYYQDKELVMLGLSTITMRAGISKIGA